MVHIALLREHPKTEDQMRKTWFVTGASRGLGSAIVDAATARGDRVVATSRNTAALARFEGRPDVAVAAVDVTDPKTVTRAMELASARFGSLDVVVNNAGQGLVGAVEEISDMEARALFDINFFGMLTVIRAALPPMRRQGSGRIVNISSVAGIRSVAGSSLYSASKHAVEGMSAGLRLEVVDQGIGVMVVEPGAFRTSFMTPESMTFAAVRLDAYQAGPVHRTRAFVASSAGTEPGDPTRAAALIVDAASAAQMPSQLPVGADALAIADVMGESIRDSLVPWREQSAATSFQPTCTPGTTSS